MMTHEETDTEHANRLSNIAADMTLDDTGGEDPYPLLVAVAFEEIRADARKAAIEEMMTAMKDDAAWISFIHKIKTELRKGAE